MSENSNRWLRAAYKWLMPIALVAAISVAAITVISASSHGDGRSRDQSQRWSEGDSGDDCDRLGKHGLGAGIAELIGTDAEGLKTALSDGKTLAEIAEENGVEVQSVIDALVERANERIDAAVESGKLTAEEAETKKSEVAEKIEAGVNDGFSKDRLRSWGKGRWSGTGLSLQDSIERN